MNKRINDGGTAFPQSQHVGDVGLSEGGMTLRDYFAGKALPECLHEFYAFLREGNQVPEDWRTGVALDAYAMADAMLAARDTDTTER